MLPKNRKGLDGKVRERGDKAVKAATDRLSTMPRGWATHGRTPTARRKFFRRMKANMLTSLRRNDSTLTLVI